MNTIERLIAIFGSAGISCFSFTVNDGQSLQIRAGGETLGEREFSKDHRPEPNQMVVGAILDGSGRHLRSEMWPGDITKVQKTLAPVMERSRERFNVSSLCIVAVADRGVISKDAMSEFDDPANKGSCILGVRVRSVKEVRGKVLADKAEFREIRPEGKSSKDPSPRKTPFP